MSKKTIIIVLAVAIAVGAGAFYGGLRYGTTKAETARTAGRGTGAGTGFGGGARGGQGGPMGQRGAAGQGDFAAGQIISKDDTSVTIKNRAGGSQIVYFSGSTSIGKSVSGTAADLSVGETITASGKNSPDGSLAAQDIQIRPAQPDQAT